jgi:hypothetical protein
LPAGRISGSLAVAVSARRDIEIGAGGHGNSLGRAWVDEQDQTPSILITAALIVNGFFTGMQLRMGLSWALIGTQVVRISSREGNSMLKPNVRFLGKAAKM